MITDEAFCEPYTPISTLLPLASSEAMETLLATCTCAICGSAATKKGAAALMSSGAGFKFIVAMCDQCLALKILAGGDVLMRERGMPLSSLALNGTQPS